MRGPIMPRQMMPRQIMPVQMMPYPLMGGYNVQQPHDLNKVVAGQMY